MNKAFFYIGGMIILTTIILFLYFVLLRGETNFMQWLAAILLAGIGASFMAIGNKDGRV